MKTKPEQMLTYLTYLIQVAHGLILNPHLNIVLYVGFLVSLFLQLHLLLPCILSCCVGRVLSAFPAENHWELRSLAAVVLATIYRKFSFCERLPVDLEQTILGLKSKFLLLFIEYSITPRRLFLRSLVLLSVRLCEISHIGATRMGDSAVVLLLVPVCRDMITNLAAFLTADSVTIQVQARRCLYALIVCI